MRSRALLALLLSVFALSCASGPDLEAAQVKAAGRLAIDATVVALAFAEANSPDASEEMRARFERARNALKIADRTLAAGDEVAARAHFAEALALIDLVLAELEADGVHVPSKVRSALEAVRILAGR